MKSLSKRTSSTLWNVTDTWVGTGQTSVPSLFSNMAQTWHGPVRACNSRSQVSSRAGTSSTFMVSGDGPDEYAVITQVEETINCCLVIAGVYQGIAASTRVVWPRTASVRRFVTTGADSRSLMFSRPSRSICTTGVTWSQIHYNPRVPVTEWCITWHKKLLDIRVQQL